MQWKLSGDFSYHSKNPHIRHDPSGLQFPIYWKTHPPYLYESQVDDLPITQATISAFTKEWAKIDKKSTSYISIKDLPKLIVGLSNHVEGQDMLVFPKLIRMGDDSDIENYISLL